MNPELHEYFIVVTARGHNPTIINPDFLLIQNIVKKEWGWATKGDVITTPPFASVIYNSEVALDVQADRLRVSHKTDDPTKSEINEIVTNYVQTLKHIPYQAIGLNFIFLIPIENPKEYLINTYLKDGPWKSNKFSLDTLGLHFVYENKKQSRISLKLDSGTRKIDDNTESILTANFNVHRQCIESNKPNEIVNQMSKVKDYWDECNYILKEILVN